MSFIIFKQVIVAALVLSDSLLDLLVLGLDEVAGLSDSSIFDELSYLLNVASVVSLLRQEVKVKGSSRAGLVLAKLSNVLLESSDFNLEADARDISS